MRIAYLWGSIIALAIATAACGGSGGGNGNADAAGTGGDGNGGGGDGSGSAGGTTISVTLTDHPNTAATFSFVVAYQDGSGAWTLAPAPTGDTYSFTVTAPVWGFAWTCIATGATAATTREVNEYHFAVSERKSLTLTVPPRCSDRNPANVTLSGTVSNRSSSGGGVYTVVYGNHNAVLVGGGGGYTLETPPGTHDLFLFHGTIAAGTGDLAVDAAYVMRGVAVTAATTQNLDASMTAATQSFAVSATTTATNHTATTTLYTANDSSPTFDLETMAPYTSVALAAAQGASGDVYDQTFTVGGAGNSETATNATSAPAAYTVTVPAALGGETTSTATATPYVRLSTTWSAYANAIGYVWSAAQACGTGCTDTWTATLSNGVIGSAPSYEMPDLSALTGWSAMLPITAGTMTETSVQAVTSSAGAGDFPIGVPADGTQRTFAKASVAVTP